MISFFRKNKAELTNEEKVSNTKVVVAGAMEMFSHANQSIVEANETLEKVIIEDTQKADAINDNIRHAQAELLANKELQKQIQPFIKGATI